MAHVRQGIRLRAKLKNNRAKYKLKYTVRQRISTKNNKRKYTYTNSKRIYRKKYAYKL